MKVLYISAYYKPAYVYGGPTRTISTLCEGLTRLGANVTVLTTNANGATALDVPLGRSVDVDGVSVYYYPVATGFPRTFFYSPDLASASYEMIREHDLVVLETLFTHSMGPAVSACLKTNTPYIIPPRGELLPWALRQKFLKKQLYMLLMGRRYLNRASALQCSDPVERDSLRKLRLKAPAFVIPNSLSACKWKKLPLRGRLRRQLGILETGHVLLMLGRLHRVKNPELAVQMLGLLHGTDTHLIFAGPDEEGYQAQLQVLASGLGCAGCVHFTGLLTGESILQAMADADLLVMPSAMESFGMAAVEAMASGLPVLLSEHVPIGRWVERAGAGRQVACTPEAFATACQDMLHDEDGLKEMGSRARALVLQRFDTSIIANQMLSQCEAIVSQGMLLSEM